MKKVVLKKVDLVKFKDFIDSLVPLSDAGTVYFKLTPEGLVTDSHNEAGNIIKSIKTSLGEICEESDISTFGKTIKLCFYEGKKVLKAFSFLSGNEINCEITFVEYEGEYYSEKLKISSPKVSITLDGADPSLFEFENVPEDAMESIKNSYLDADCSFRISANEIMQIQKFCDFDTNEDITFSVNGEVKVISDDSFDFSIADDFEGVENPRNYKLSKELFNLIDTTSYKVYPIADEDRMIFKAEDNSIDIVVTLNEDFDI